MSQVQSPAQILPFAQPRTAAARVLRSVAIVFLGTILLAIAAHITAPFFFTPVPFTLQSLAVLAIALLVEPSLAAATLVAYLVEGVCGLPVFAPAAAVGVAAMLSASAGFLWAFPVAAFVVSKLYRTLRPARFSTALFASAIGAAIYFIGGAAWFAAMFHQSLRVTLDLTVWPFLAGDALKVVLAAAFVTGLYSLRTRRNSQPAQ